MRGGEPRTATGAHAGHAAAPPPGTGDVPQTRLVPPVLREAFLGLAPPPNLQVAGWLGTGSRADRGAGPAWARRASPEACPAPGPRAPSGRTAFLRRPSVFAIFFLHI